MTHDVIERVPAAQTLGEWRMPTTFELWLTGLYSVPPEHQGTVRADPTLPCPRERAQLLVQVAPAPIWIRAVSQLLDTKEVLVELCFYDSIKGVVETIWLDRQKISSKMRLLELSGSGVPVTDANAGVVSQYLVDGLALCGNTLPVVQMQRRTGRVVLPRKVGGTAALALDVPSDVGYLLGRRWIGPEGTTVQLDPRVRALIIDGFETAGSEQQWFDVLRSLLTVSATARWFISAVFAAPLLRVVDHRTFVIHNWCLAGSGKSALVKFALSAAGDANKLIRTFNGTRISRVETFSLVSDVAIAFDELQATNEKDVSHSVYDLCLERGRQRAKKDGGIQEETADWKSIVYTTGEEPLVGKNTRFALEGQANRVVQIATPILDSTTASLLHRWLERKSHGWGMLRFTERLVEELAEHGPGRICRLFERLKSAILQSTTVAAPHAGNLAIVGAAMTLCGEWFFEQEPDYAEQLALLDCEEVGRQLVIDEQSEPVVRASLQVLHDDMHAQRGRWLDADSPFDGAQLRDGTYRALTGVLRGNEVWLIQREANRLLEQAGIPARRAWADLARAGVLVKSATERGFSQPRRCGKFRARCYVLSRTASPADNPFSDAGE